jgi:hypothetical protein
MIFENISEVAKVGAIHTPRHLLLCTSKPRYQCVRLLCTTYVNIQCTVILSKEQRVHTATTSWRGRQRAVALSYKLQASTKIWFVAYNPTGIAHYPTACIAYNSTRSSTIQRVSPTAQRSVNQVWIKCESSVDQVWIRCGSGVDQVWIR